MKLKYFLIIGIFLLSINFTSAYFCLQQTSNKSTSGDDVCNLTYNGTYENGFGGSFTPFNNTYDADWNTYGQQSTSNAEYIVNYSKPNLNNSVNLTGAIFNYKDSSTIAGGPRTVNVSIPSICFNQSIISIKLIAQTQGPPNYLIFSRYYCRNNTGYQLFDSSGTGRTTPRLLNFFEESIYWNVTTPSTNCWTKTGTGTGSILFIPKGCVYNVLKGVIG
jgi:hypothetical protein